MTGTTDRTADRPAAALRAVRKSYGPVTVLDIPELELARGQITCVVGENGAGKSTLMGVLAGTVSPTSGEVLIADRPLQPGRPDHAKALGVSLVAQEFPLVGRLSVAENLLLGRRARVAQGAGALSGGNQQKVVFGRWLHASPEVLLLDEPTRGVDVGAKAEIYRLVDRAAADGLAVLAASSELEELLWICHRILVMAHGRIVADLPRELFSKERIMTAATSRPEPAASTEATV
ncbi:ATP-binding cassette domain-containing protein [Kitasatospora sp. NPDC059648]|uniref:ATP-binding cassette domain-containing protein n=1 Tax=Kitasatospora sp. NPDC059648 TaxID=3346894 RepID=UPI0036999E66